jgi:hypothetical protein
MPFVETSKVSEEIAPIYAANTLERRPQSLRGRTAPRFDFRYADDRPDWASCINHDVRNVRAKRPPSKLDLLFTGENPLSELGPYRH